MSGASVSALLVPGNLEADRVGTADDPAGGGAGDQGGVDRLGAGLPGTAEDLQVLKAEASGADFCLEKATHFEELLAKIGKLLQSEAD